jgi:S1-C subfamily serine protease
MAAAAAVLLVQSAPLPADANNAMGYSMLTAADAARLPRNHGVLGIEVDRAGEISDAGLDFEVMRIKAVHSGSPGQAAGLRTGDEIIAVDGRVFPSIAAFASYIGSLPPGTPASFDTIPSGGGPAQAERLAVRIGPNPSHMSTGEKLAIGAGAVALLGCYEMGCFHHRQTPPVQTQPR